MSNISILKSFYLDFTRATPLEYIFAKQGDVNSRILEITPLNSGLIYNIPSGVTARFGAKKPDGTQVLNDAEVRDGKIYVTLTEQTLAACGIARAEIALYGLDSTLLSSQHFWLKIEPFAIDPNAAESSDEYLSFVTALLALDEAIAASENVNISAVQTTTGADITVTDRNGVQTTVHVDTKFAVHSWNDFQQIVRLGIAPQLCPVGTEISTYKTISVSAAVGTASTGITGASVDEDKFMLRRGKSENAIYTLTFDGDNWASASGNIILKDYGITVTGSPVSGDKIIITEDAHKMTFVVAGYDNIKTANAKLTHTATLMSKHAYGTKTAYIGLQFDASEALYFAEHGLEPGPYSFTVKNQAWYEADNDVTYYFTLNSPVPVGGQLVLAMTYNQTLEGKTLKVYAGPSESDVIESTVLSSASVSGAINLGNTDGLTENMNHMHRICFGSNNYAQSALRQWANSEGKAGTYWTPTNKFDRAPSFNTSSAQYDGFAHGFGADFKKVLQTAIIPCRTNSFFEVESIDGTVYNTDETYTVEDKYFLLSRPEIYGDWDSSALKDGEQLELFEGTTQQEKIIYDEFGSARYAWLRSPGPWNASSERIVSTSGALDSYGASNSFGAAVACIIA